ncbi:hypothetical protein Plec18167_007343 [Paecilomyces lecythidis]|uniref:Putative gamma-glutamylcyclotransferase n=1 Tax=Paecilomyces lecythidis TaxID=3004212 RepID=A0ABR3X3R0_9EURO
MNQNKIPIFVRKLIAAEKEAAGKEAKDTEPTPCDPAMDYIPFRKEYYFFYGTLMDPATLMKVLDLSEEPTLLPTKVMGYYIKLWGKYPALLDGMPGNWVYGMAYEVQSQEHLDRLIAYETEKYAIESCGIWPVDSDGSARDVIGGETFLWNGKPEELSEGEFSLEEWKREENEALANERG